MDHAHHAPAIPIVVRLGFAGSRNLFDSAADDVADPVAFEDNLSQQFTALLGALHGDLGLSARHFFCGVSQIACGGDAVFTRACSTLRIPQRIFLPRPLNDFLADNSSAGPDFSDAQREHALRLLEGGHIIQQAVASSSDDRTQRFADTSLEILLASDVIIALVRSGQTGKPGGTLELIQMAEKRGLPVWVLTIEVKNGQPSLVPHWRRKDLFARPALPHALDHIPSLPAAESGTHGRLPDAGLYTAHLKSHASKVAESHQGFFKAAAFTIIGTHILATVCAVLTLKFHSKLSHSASWFMGTELLLIGTGFWIHHRLHRREAGQQWASARLLAELARSVSALGRQHLQPDYLFQLPFPDRFQSLLHTLNVLHLASTDHHADEPWQERRDDYLARRLDGANGQIAFYTGKSTHAAKWLHWAHTAFNSFSIGAFLTVGCEILLPHGGNESLLLGPLAILLPVLAVAALSLSAAFDLEARKHTFSDMLVFLNRQRHLLIHASSEREFRHLLLLTESRLLGETVNWFSRRSFTGIA